MNKKKIICCVLASLSLSRSYGSCIDKIDINYSPLANNCDLNVKSGFQRCKNISDKCKAKDVIERSNSLKDKPSSLLQFIKDHKVGIWLGVGGASLVSATGCGLYKIFSDPFYTLLFLSVKVGELHGGHNNIGVSKRKHLWKGNYVFKNCKLIYHNLGEELAYTQLEKCTDRRIKKPIAISKLNKCCISEMAPGKNIEEYAKDIAKCSYKEKLIKSLKIIKQLCEVTLEISKFSIEHGDMHKENWFVNEEDGEPIVYIIDFGNCKNSGKTCYLPMNAIFDVESSIFGALGYFEYEYDKIKPCTSEGYKNMEYLIKLEDEEVINMRNSMFAILSYFVHTRRYCTHHIFNPLISVNGCMTKEEVKKLFSDNNKGYLRDGDPEVVRRFIKYLDNKISDISNMSSKDAEKICPVTKIDKSNVRKFTGEEISNETRGNRTMTRYKYQEKYYMEMKKLEDSFLNI